MLQDKVAVVTGASRGIGRAIALELADKGADVVVNYANNTEKAEEVAREIEAKGRKALCLKADIRDEKQMKESVKQVIHTFGRIDILVNNAGVTNDNLIMRMKEEAFDEVVDTNLKGVFICTKAVARQMMKQKSGKIVNVASIVGVTGNAGQANYAAAKSGVIGLTKTTAQEFASRNILVNAVAPGFITTEMTDALSEEQTEAMLDMIPLNTLGKSEDVAKAVRFLASDDANYITGQTIHIDGGMVMS